MIKVDRTLLILTIMLVVGGFFIFTSASLGLLAREGARFSSVAFSQIIFGMLFGSILLIVTSNIRYRKWRTYALLIFGLSVVSTFLVFVPGLGFEAGGAKRWLSVGSFSIQPAEFLKIGYVIYLSAYLSSNRAKTATFLHGLIPFLGITAVAAVPLLLQPDTGTLLVLLSAGTAMFLVAGARLRDLLATALIPIGGVLILAISRPYVRDRLMTFLDPSADPLGTGYQIQQSLIAIGSGQWFGRGFGQSVQKFNFLPEPIGDSVFAVFSEEFGFLGAFILVSLFLAFAFRGLKIASQAPDYFGGLLVVGVVILIVSQSFINIASMLAVLPLTGLPLVFISHGGTALFFALGSIGIVLNVSKYRKT
ncbi:MAG: cell division protein FtsW [Parcubacteria group bacterium]|nr:cell division protein FtsW [Parcubacteria group bacterium]